MDKEQNPVVKQKKSKGQIIVCIICSIMIVAAVLMLAGYMILERHGRKEIEKVTDSFISSLNNKSGTELYGLLSDEYIDYMRTEYGYSKLDVIKEMENSLDFFQENAETENGYDLGRLQEISVYDSDVEDFDTDELSEMKAYFRSELDMVIEDYAQVNLKCHVSGEKRRIQMLLELYLYQMNGKWYFLDWYWVGLEG